MKFNAYSLWEIMSTLEMILATLLDPCLKTVVKCTDWMCCIQTNWDSLKQTAHPNPLQSPHQKQNHQELQTSMQHTLVCLCSGCPELISHVADAEWRKCDCKIPVEVQRYLSDPDISLTRTHAHTHDPLYFWTIQKTVYSHLPLHVLEFLVTPASVLCANIFKGRGSNKKIKE